LTQTTPVVAQVKTVESIGITVSQQFSIELINVRQLEKLIQNLEMKPYSTDLRNKIIETKHKTNESTQKLADRFQVSYCFVNRLLKRYEATASVEASPHGGGKPPLINSQQLDIISQLVEADNDATLQQLCTRLEEKTGVKVSVPTMCRLLQKLELNRKKKTIHANEAETERVQNLRREYWKTIGEVKLSDLVFIDETGVNLAMTRRYARAKKGKRAYGKCPYNRGRNVTLIGAISLKAILASFTFEGWTNQEAFLTYVTEVLVPQLWDGACVVMDNLTAHKTTAVREAIEAVGARVIFLSPYSPDFNPIENCWSKIKEYLRSCESRTYTALDKAITEAINLVTQDNLIGWFTHCCYYVPFN
jgi:transposase